jgi:hypothetical protein
VGVSTAVTGIGELASDSERGCGPMPLVLDGVDALPRPVIEELGA